MGARACARPGWEDLKLERFDNSAWPRAAGWGFALCKPLPNHTRANPQRATAKANPTNRTASLLISGGATGGKGMRTRIIPLPFIPLPISVAGAGGGVGARSTKASGDFQSRSYGTVRL